jgi:hypothetical protein
MNEQQIEAKAERMADKVDARYLNGEMSEAEYERRRHLAFAYIEGARTWQEYRSAIHALYVAEANRATKGQK